MRYLLPLAARLRDRLASAAAVDLSTAAATLMAGPSPVLTPGNAARVAAAVDAAGGARENGGALSVFDLSIDGDGVPSYTLAEDDTHRWDSGGGGGGAGGSSGGGLHPPAGAGAVLDEGLASLLPVLTPTWVWGEGARSRAAATLAAAARGLGRCLLDFAPPPLAVLICWPHPYPPPRTVFGLPANAPPALPPTAAG